MSSSSMWSALFIIIINAVLIIIIRIHGIVIAVLIVVEISYNVSRQSCQRGRSTGASPTVTWRVSRTLGPSRIVLR